MTEENLRLLEKIYQQYKDPVKPLLAEIEAVYEKFPLPIYNEIRALNDHVARAFFVDTDEKSYEQIMKAKSHMSRIARDCYKFLNMYYRIESEKFDKMICSVEPRSQEDFRRMAEYGELSDKATELVEHAKDNEHLVSDEETYSNFQKAYNAYQELHKFIKKNRRDIFAMRRKKKVKVAGSVIFSLFTFVLGCILTNNNVAIIDAILKLFNRN